MSPELLRTILRSAWWAIALGLFLEGVQLAALAASGAPAASGGVIAADTAQKVTWSFIVCMALSCGTAATRAGPTAIGALGLLAAPVAFAVARAVHKSVAQVLSLGLSAGGPSPWTLAAIKGLEYGILGWLVTRLLRRPELRLPAYVRTGLLIGVLFGGLQVWLMNRAAPGGLAAPALLARSLNELLFPVGCSCVIWVTGVLTRRTS